MAMGFGAPLDKNKPKKDARIERRKNRASRIRDNRVIRAEHRRNFNLFGGTLGLVIILIFSYAIFKFALNDTYTFSFMGLLQELQDIPMIDIKSVVTASLDFPSWLSWLEEIIQFFAVWLSMIANVIIVIIWFLRMLFL